MLFVVCSFALGLSLIQMQSDRTKLAGLLLIGGAMFAVLYVAADYDPCNEINRRERAPDTTTDPDPTNATGEVRKTQSQSCSPSGSSVGGGPLDRTCIGQRLFTL
jgi:hypothetical protein